MILRSLVLAVTTYCGCYSFNSVVHAFSCQHFSGEEFLIRIEDHLKQCYPTNDLVQDQIMDRVASNELALRQDRQPLSIVFFSNSSTLLDIIATSFATALGGINPSSSTIQVIDFRSLVDITQTNHMIREKIRQVIASNLRVCGHHRTLFILRHLEVVTNKRLPLLDVFLDPMNGKRAQFYDAVQDRVLECQQAIFLFLFDTSKISIDETKDWRFELQSHWTTTMDRSGLEQEVFTPQAMIGRLTDGIIIKETEYSIKETIDWKEKCSMDRLLGILKIQQENSKITSLTTETNTDGPSTCLIDTYRFLWDRTEISWLFLALIPFFMLCNLIPPWRQAIANREKSKVKVKEELNTNSQVPTVATSETVPRTTRKPIKGKIKVKQRIQKTPPSIDIEDSSIATQASVEESPPRPLRRSTRARRTRN